MSPRSTTSALLARLSKLGVLREGVEALNPPSVDQPQLPALCELGLLDGGVSVALDVLPDEALGALCAAVGGRATELRVLDVRSKPVELLVRFGASEQRWKTANVAALADRLNKLLAVDASARAIAVLGEWKEALQLWCVPKAVLPDLLRETFFVPKNLKVLRGLK